MTPSPSKTRALPLCGDRKGEGAGYSQASVQTSSNAKRGLRANTFE
jgi:hypothetical protein